MSVITLPMPATGSLRDLGRLQDIPAVRQLMLLGIVAAAIALGLWLFFWTQHPDYVPVSAGLDAKTTSEASDLLRAQQIPFRIDAGSGALAVPADRLGDAKMALASAGLSSGNGEGFESMEGDQGFGTSQFVETARYQHVLETELGRTIANLRPVREARVHLALPKPSAFTRQKENASASVVLQLRSGAALEPGQVDAIVHLVASSIADLTPDRVTVVDQYGRMLTNPDPGSDAAIGALQLDQQHRQESVYVQRIQELLEPMTGPGRVSAQVSVDMDFNQTEEARESYGPQGAMVRSEQVSETGASLAPSSGSPATPAHAQGVPGSASNTPGAGSVAAQNAASTPATSTADVGPTARTAVRNYEIDRTLTHTRQAPGRIRRITAAVLVDNVPAAAPAKAGKPALRPLSPTEIQRIQTLVQQAVGFDPARGDVVSVVNASFARDAVDGETDAPPIWQNPIARDLLRTLLGGLAVLLVVWVVLRPAFRQLLAPRGYTPSTARVEMIEEEVPVTLGSLAGGPSPGPAKLMNFDEKLNLARSAVSTDPKRVAQVVRDMVGADG